MGLGQMMFVIFAMLLLSLLSLNAGKIMLSNNAVVQDGDVLVAATGIAQTVIERTKSQAFDEIPVGNQVRVGNVPADTIFTDPTGRWQLRVDSIKVKSVDASLNAASGTDYKLMTVVVSNSMIDRGVVARAASGSNKAVYGVRLYYLFTNWK